LQSWDYGTNGAYFVTICTHERHHSFGKIQHGEMQLNAAGRIAVEIWRLLPDQFPYVVLDEFVVMPNHMHGLLYIDKSDNASSTDAINRVSADSDSDINPDPHQNIGGITGDKNPMLQENLSRIIRWYKGRTTFEIRKCSADAINFAWQTRFHDHIVRTNDAFLRIQAYILNNPLKWTEDKFHH
jgi:putative transposase